MTISKAEKVRENKLRRMAARQGYMLQRSKRRDPDALDYGLYWLVDISTNFVVFGGPGVTGGPTADLDDIEEWLTTD